jgi:hypothetical protein
MRLFPTILYFVPFQADELTKEDFKGSKVRHLSLLFSSLIDSNHHLCFLLVFVFPYHFYFSQGGQVGLKTNFNIKYSNSCLFEGIFFA